MLLLSNCVGPPPPRHVPPHSSREYTSNNAPSLCTCIRMYVCVSGMYRGTCVWRYYDAIIIIVCLCITTHLCPEAHSHTHRTHTPSITHLPKGPLPNRSEHLEVAEVNCTQPETSRRKTVMPSTLHTVHAYIHGVLVDLVEFTSQKVFVHQTFRQPTAAFFSGVTYTLY